MLSKQLEGKVALVTGAGSGIGRGIAMVLATRGAAVAVVDLDGVRAKEVAGKIAGARSYVADVTDKSSVAAAAEAVIGDFDGIDICVPNAGVIGGPGFTERREYKDVDWEATHSVNLRGAVNTAHAVRDHMVGRGAGRIVNIASHSGRPPRGGGDLSLGTVQIPYSVSKAGVIHWTMHLALQLAPHGVTVNAVCPGTLWTPMWERIAEMRQRYQAGTEGLSTREIFDQRIAGTMPLGRPQTPEDVGNAVAFLASDDARIITGQALNVNGGAVMS